MSPIRSEGDARMQADEAGGNVEVLEPPRLSQGRYAAPHCRAAGTVSSARAQPSALDLWIVDAELRAGATLQWARDHGDEAVVVLSGEAEVEGERCPPGAAIVIEAGAAVTLVSRTGATIVHFGGPARGAHVPGSASGSRGCGVHIVGPGPARGSVVPRPHGAIFAGCYADSTCPTCRLTLLRVVGDGTIRGSSHSHSQNELIRVLDGELRFGRRNVSAGMTAAIPADRHYAFQTSKPFLFLNYRPGPSTMRSPHHPAPLRESAEAMGWRDMGVRNHFVPAALEVA
jgi:quercetin dioxygenase-like cupin family protein